MKDFSLERHEMHAIISRGESVLLNGQLITRHEDLPSAVTMAKNDPEELAKVTADLVSRRRELDRMIAEANAQAKLLEESSQAGYEEEEDDEPPILKPVRRRTAPVGQTVVTTPVGTEPGQNLLTGENVIDNS